MSVPQLIPTLRFHGPERLQLDHVTLRDPQPYEVRLRPLAAGLCGTDAHILHGEFPAAAPVVLGHEVAGVVESVGSSVRDLKEGDLVTVQPNTFCGVCRYCRTGREHLCSQLRAYGVHMDGGFAQSMVAAASALYKLPPDTDPRLGALVEPLACCIHGVDRASIRSGSTVLIIGAGLIGLLLSRLVRLAGAGLVSVSEPQEKRRAKALAFGVDSAAPAGAEGEQQLIALTDNEGFDVVIDAVGSTATFEVAIRMAARGASVLVFGVAAPNAVANLLPYQIYSRELTVVGSFINPYTHERAVNLLPQMQLDQLSFQTFKLQEYQQAFSAQANATDASKVVLLPQE